MRLDLGLSYKVEGEIFDKKFSNPKDIKAHQFKMVKFNLKFNQTENTSILPSLKGLNITESLCEIYIMING